MSKLPYALLTVAALALGCGGSERSLDAGLPDGPQSTPDAASPVPDAAGSGPDAACASPPIVWSAQFHNEYADVEALADVLAARRFGRVRSGFWTTDPSSLARFRDLATRLAAHGIEVETVLMNEYTAIQDCTADLATVEANAHARTLEAVRQSDDLTHIYELQNEVSLWLVPGTEGESAGEFDTPCGRLQAANLRGMSRAIVDERDRTGLPLVILLGAVGRSWGFLTFMEQQGVVFDRVGYHIYPWEAHAPLDEDAWYGEGGPLGQLALFGRPVHVNEFNCGETYSGSSVYPDHPVYENLAGQPVTEACLRSLAKHLKEIVHQTAVDVESVSFYELIDEPWKDIPENRFGLMYDAASPKVQLFLASAFTGGPLTSDEAWELTSRGLLTDEEIASYATCGATP